MTLVRRSAAALLILCTLLEAQDRRRRTRPKSDAGSGKNDWPSLVRKAHEHPRMMLRRAIANRIAKAGGEAVPAVRAWARDKGRNELGLQLVVAYQASRARDAATLGMLRDWATDRDFYWRSQALGALARFGQAEDRGRFETGTGDPSHLFRIEAARGLLRLGTPAAARELRRSDPDPRARLEAALMLVQAGRHEALPSLVAALQQEHSFLDLPWAKLGALDAFKQLRKTLGEDHGYKAGAPVAENRAAIARIEAAAKARCGDAWQAVEPLAPDRREYLGGLSIRSCRNGDYFLRWTAAGELIEGLAPELLAKPGEALLRLSEAPPTRGDKIVGRVVCDYLRLVVAQPETDIKVAPSTLPAAVDTWLQDLNKLGLPRGFAARLAQFRSGN